MRAFKWRELRTRAAFAFSTGAFLGVFACSSSDGGGGTNGGASANGGAFPSSASGAPAGGAALGGSTGLAGAVAMAGSGVAGSDPGGGTSAGGSAGGAAIAGAGGSASAAGGTGATAGAGGAGTGGAGAAGTAGNGGANANCAGRVISLSENGTGSDSDAARARVVIDLMSDLPIGNALRTVEFWAFIKSRDWVGEKNEIFEYGGTGTTAAFGLDFGTNAVTGMAGNHATLNPYTNGGFNDDSTAYLGITSAMPQWVHVALVWDGTAIQTYVNGALRITSRGTNGVTQLATTQTAFTLGCNDPKFNCFNGYFDELRIWKVARSASEIQSSYKKTLLGNEAGLVGYWKFDEAPGTATAADSVITQGHIAHAGQLMAVMASQRPTFVTPSPPTPLSCP